MNETFKDAAVGGHAATTTRGEEVLQRACEKEMYLPEQGLEVPSYHPYNTRLASRRLDYVFLRGLRGAKGGVLRGTKEVALSDHEAVAVITDATTKTRPKHKGEWGARVLKEEDMVAAALQQHTAGDPHTQLANVAKQITRPAPAPGEPWQESPELKQLRVDAHAAPAAGRRQAWKAVWKPGGAQGVAQTQGGSGVPSQLGGTQIPSQPPRTRALGREVVRRRGVASSAKTQGIFAKAPAAQVEAAMGALRHKLRGMCKHQPWKPFTQDELEATSEKWGKCKATGMDGVALEALRELKQHQNWRGKLQWMLDDFLYTGQLRGEVGRGVTVLLRKVRTPQEWGDTRPITLSTTMLKWMSQLLLNRGAHHLTPLTQFQWAWKGKQAEELLMLMRKLTRAADSVLQQSLGAMVAYWVGERGKMPWEAHAWLSLLQAQRIQVAAGGELVDVRQTTGVRQGAPDSPVLFSALMGRILQLCLPPLPPKGEARLPATTGVPDNRGGLHG